MIIIVIDVFSLNFVKYVLLLLLLILLFHCISLGRERGSFENGTLIFYSVLGSSQSFRTHLYSRRTCFVEI